MSNENVNTKLRPIAPHVDIYENEDHLLFLADVPGVTSDKLQVRLDNGTLSFEGATAAFVYRRSFDVPHTIDAERVSAELKHGVVRITLPKAAAMRTRTIPIKAA